MGNFLVVISSREVAGQADRLFRTGLALAQSIKFQKPTRVVEAPWVRMASFARQNGTGTPIVSEARTGSWLLSIGTWFHEQGFGSGEQVQLLDRYLTVGGERLGREMEGFFVVVIGDARTRETIVLTDINGSCHGFLRSQRGWVALSGSSLLLASLGTFHLDAVGCQEFLEGGISYEDRTFYREVRKLPPATVMRFSEGARIAERRYWKISDLAPESLDGPRAVEGLWHSLTQAARDITRIHERPACDLTGGYDSRALVAAFLATNAPFSTVVTGAKTKRDVVVAKALARITGMPHLNLLPKEQMSFDQVCDAHGFTDGEFDPVEYAGILHVHRILAEHFDISINGSYGGIARALWWELLLPHIGARRKLDAHKLARSRYASGRFDPSLFPPGTRVNLTSHLTGVVERINERLWDLPNTLQMDHINLAMRIHRWQGRIASSTNQLWPCLSPFGFRTVLETVLQTRSRLRLGSLLVRRMLSEYQPRLAEAPLDRGYPAAPVTWKNVHRFHPMLRYYVSRVSSKLARMAGLGIGPAAPGLGLIPARLQLWREEPVRELMNPETMRVRTLLDPVALRHFLVLSQREDFAFNEQWNRLLSLEYTLQVLERARVLPSASK